MVNGVVVGVLFCGAPPRRAQQGRRAQQNQCASSTHVCLPGFPLRQTMHPNGGYVING